MTQHRLSDRHFGVAITAVFLVIAGTGWYFFGELPRWAVVGAGAAALIVLVAPGLLLPINRLWGVLAHVLAGIVNFFLLSAFFYLLVLPLGLIIRLSGRDAMHRNPDPKASTYWTPVTRHTDESTLPDMF